MERYILNRRNILTAGLATLTLLATAGCATLKHAKIEPVYFDSPQSYIDNSSQGPNSTSESVKGKKLPTIYVGIKGRF